jgi:DNA modification methylase
VTVRILRGDCRHVLKTLPDELVQCIVTSPPYWGLRDYGTEPQVWGGDADCPHEWGVEGKRHRGGPPGDSPEVNDGRDRSAIAATADIMTGRFCARCGAWRGSLGLEPTPQLYVEHLVEVFAEVHRVLRPDGTLWLNLGDCYATGAGSVGDHPGGGEQGARWRGETTRHRDAKRRQHGQPTENGRGEAQVERTRALRDGSHAGKHVAMAAMGPMTQPNRMPIPGLKPKDLVMIPARAALALQAWGWWVRQDVIWDKQNPMPESVRDRCTKAHEYIFLLTKSERYYFDADAIAEPVAESTLKDRVDTGKRRPERGYPGAPSAGQGRLGDKPTRNKRSVWRVPTQPFKEAHFATFPPALIEPCILAGAPKLGIVLDPFGGAGTTGLVADRLGRDAILIELNPSYADMAHRRIAGDAPLLTEVAA